MFYSFLTLKLPITTIVVCCLSSACDFKNHFCKQCGPKSDCSSRSSLIWVHIVCLYAKIGLEKLVRIFSRRHKQTTFSDAGFLGVLRVNIDEIVLCCVIRKFSEGLDQPQYSLNWSGSSFSIYTILKTVEYIHKQQMTRSDSRIPFFLELYEGLWWCLIGRN